MTTVTIKLLGDVDETYSNVNTALQYVRDMHGSMTGEEHDGDADVCACVLGDAVRELNWLRHQFGMARFR